MSKLTMKDATRILNQIKNGEWIANVRREWDHTPQSGKVYALERNGVSLWVSNGIGFLRVNGESFENKFIKIPLHIKIYLWFFGVRSFVSSQVKEFNKNDAAKDYNCLSDRMK